MTQTEQIIHAESGCTLVGAGALDPRDLDAAIRLAPYLIAVDGGADACLEFGHRPQKVIGDLDSISADTRAIISDRLVPIEEQDSTDMEKALQSINAPIILCLGFLGHRLDHQLAALNAVAKFSLQKAILLGTHDICFLCPEHLLLTLPPKTRFSIFPVENLRVDSRGLKWPTNGLELSPAERIGTSNETCETEVHLSVLQGKALVILPKQMLPNVLAEFR